MQNVKELKKYHLLTTRMQTYFPYTATKGIGTVVFLYAPFGSTSIFDIMGSKTNFVNSQRAIHYYYYPVIYRGNIGEKRYQINDNSQQISNYDALSRRGRSLNSVQPYPTKLITPTTKRSMYYDMSKYLDIFAKSTARFNTYRKIDCYWKYLNRIISDPRLKLYTDKMVILRAEDYSNFNSRRIKDKIDNPIFMLYFSLYKKFEYVKTMDIDFYITAGDRWNLYINPSKCDETSYRVFLVQLRRLFSHTDVVQQVTTELNETKLNDDFEKQKAAEDLVETIIKGNEMRQFADFVTVDTPTEEETPTLKGFNNTPDDTGEDDKAEVVDAVTDIADEPPIIADDEEVQSKSFKELEEEKKKKLEEDKEEEALLSKIYEKTTRERTPVREVTPREKLLQEKEKTLKMGNVTLADLRKIDSSAIKITENDVSASIRTANKSMAGVKFAYFDKDYTEKLMPKDLANTFTMFHNKSLPIYVKDIKIEDTSDELNYKETYTVTMEDANRKQQTIKVDIPKILDGRFLFIGGNKKVVQKQNFLYPIVKTGPDSLQIVTNCNKMTIKRMEGRRLVTIERLLKLAKTETRINDKLFHPGNVSLENLDIITTVEYDEMALMYRSYESLDHNTKIFFSDKDAKAYALENKIKIPQKDLFIGVENGKPVYLNTDTQKDQKNRSIMEIIYESFPDDIKEAYSKIKAPKRLMYAKVTTMEQDVPVAILLSFWVGLTEFLNRAKIEYRFVEKSPREIGADEAYIQFADCYLVYKLTTSSMLLMSGFLMMDTASLPIADFDKENPYLIYFKKVYGRAIIANALMNAYEFTIDTITEEILNDLNLPTNIVDLMIYAIDLLCDNHCIPEIEQSQSRVRSMEIIPAILYYNLSRAYTNYKNSGGRKKLSIPRDCVIKDTLSLKTVEDASILNPFLEVERQHNISSKGWRGVNVDRVYTPERRSYVKSMIGVIAPSSSPDANVGLTRCLALEPKIKSLRGYCDITDVDKDGDKLTEANLFSPIELLIPFGVTRDDATRIGHMVKQSKHALPTVQSSPVLISNGAEEVIRFHLSSDFVVNAEQDGKVVEKDPSTGIMIIEYKDGSHKAVNLKSSIVKNGGGGFYMANQLTTELEVGDKFKKNDAVAWHKDFFRRSADGTTRLSVGSLQKVAIMAEASTHEDATFITTKMSKEMGAEMTFCMTVVVGKNANVDYIVSDDDTVDVGDTLIQYDTSYDEAELNTLLGGLATDPRLMETVMEDSRNNIKSKYAGTIETIKVFSTVDVDAMSPSLAKAVNKIYAKTRKKINVLNKYDKTDSIVKCGMLVDEPTKKVEPNKFGVLSGEKVDDDSVVFKFYIKHVEPLEVGSKIANYTALKNTICEVIPEGYEPWSSFRPEEEVSTIISCNSILNRMVPSILLATLGNKCQIELKRKLRDIFYS